MYGQCKAMFHMNKPSRVLYLLAYNCTLRPGKGQGGWYILIRDRKEPLTQPLLSWHAVSPPLLCLPHGTRCSVLQRGLLADIHYLLVLPRDISLNCYQELGPASDPQFSISCDWHSTNSWSRVRFCLCHCPAVPFQPIRLNTHHTFPSLHLLEPLPPPSVPLLTSVLELKPLLSGIPPVLLS